ncbi:hypothetical protein Tco_0029968, partial [Tanacetum coccineum]
EQAAKDRYWKILICYDDDEDYTIAITPVLSTKEPVDSLIIEDEHLDTIPETESDEIIKSSVESLVPIPSESEGLSNDICDVPSYDFDVESLLCRDIPITSPKIDFLSEEFAGELAPIPPGMDEDEFDEEEDDCYDDDTSSDDDSFENIDYVEASPPDSELVSLEEVKDVILRDKLSKVYLLISKIEGLNDNPTLSSFSYSNNSFSDHMEETRSGSITSRADISLSEYDSFHFNLYDVPSFPRPPPEPPDVEVCFNIQPDTTMKNDIFELYKDECFDPGGGEIVLSQNVEDENSFTFVIRNFLPFLTNPADYPLFSSTKSEYTIFDPGIST